MPEIGLIADVALDEYSSDGQDGLVRDGEILNDETVAVMVRSALVQAAAGADIIAPSDMMDGRVGAIRGGARRRGLRAHRDHGVCGQVSRRAFTARSARRWARGSGSRATRRTYQMDFANSDEALREIAQDIDEGADSVMVKPGLPYLDIVRRAKDSFNVPVFAYQVSGEYAMIELAGDAGALNRRCGDDGEPVGLQARRRQVAC